MQIGGRQAVFPFGIPAKRVAHRLAVDPGHIQIIEHTKAQHGPGRRLGLRQADLPTQPHRAGGLGGQRRAGPRQPTRNLRNRLPRQDIGVQPGVCATGCTVIPFNPARSKAGNRGQGIAGILRKLAHVGLTIERKPGFGAEPGAQLRSAPTGMDGADRNLERGAKIAGHQITGRRKADRGFARTGLPGSRSVKIALGFIGDGFRHFEQAQHGIGRMRRLHFAIQRPRQGKFHVRLAGTEPDIAHQQIMARNRLAIGRNHQIDCGGRRGTGRKDQFKPAPRVGLRLRGGLAKPTRNSGARGRVAVHFDRRVALDHGVIAPYWQQRQRCRRLRLHCRRAQPGDNQRRSGNPVCMPHQPNSTHVCPIPGTALSKANTSPAIGCVARSRGSRPFLAVVM